MELAEEGAKKIKKNEFLPGCAVFLPFCTGVFTKDLLFFYSN